MQSCMHTGYISLIPVCHTVILGLQRLLESIRAARAEDDAADRIVEMREEA